MKAKATITFLFIIFTQLFQAQIDDKFYQPSKEMKPIDLKFENISTPVEKDTITAILLKPNTAKPKATILFFHGAAGNVSTYVFMIKPLVEAGFQVAMVDFQGYGKSTGTPTHLNVAADGQKFFDTMLNRKDIKNTKILIYGASLGSQVATHLAKNNKAKISGLVIDGGMSSFADIAAVFAPQFKNALAKMLASVYSAKEDIKATEGLPKLFMYSKNDNTVPFSQGEEMYKNAAEPKQFFEFTDDHLSAVTEKPADVVKAIEALIK
ncbi:alpha/beta hydrolase [Chryseobacterium turcicum]|uniref:Alpha/beta hydrolase n=1 Tax=Chryseobacterium turcicum TaxID=2898076 RepID=A0A9Q3YWL0_9FLAO|nr:alpha/beta fold hydrolase [Chryseobacterium turcicum]MCD1116097.1 alpha/beta hydrolase [Chryseobacterium turcicum]